MSDADTSGFGAGAGDDERRRAAARRAGPTPLPSAARLAADRHSRRVRRLKILLPTAAVLIAGGIALVVYVQSRLLGALDVKSVLFSKDGLTMVEPRLSGHAKGRAYDVSAAKAFQNIQDPKVISLEGIDGRIEMADGTWTKIESTRGIYDGTHDKLALDGAVVVTTSTGWRATTEHADTDLVSGRITSDRAVRIAGKTGWIESDGIDVSDGGHQILFSRNVRMMMQPADGAAAPAGAPSTTSTPTAPPATTPTQPAPAPASTAPTDVSPPPAR